MSTPEHGRIAPKLSQESLKNIAKEAEKRPKDKKLTPEGDLANRIWKAINAFPAYSEKNGYNRNDIFEDVKETIKKTAEAEAAAKAGAPQETQAKTVVPKKQARAKPAPAPKPVEPPAPKAPEVPEPVEEPVNLRDPDVISSLMGDAIANEKRQPRKTYSADAEEEERKEMPNE